MKGCLPHSVSSRTTLRTLTEEFQLPTPTLLLNLCFQQNMPAGPLLPDSNMTTSHHYKHHVFDMCTCERTWFAAGCCWGAAGRGGCCGGPGTWVLTGCWGMGGLYTTGVPSGLRNGWPGKLEENTKTNDRQPHHLSLENIKTNTFTLDKTERFWKEVRLFCMTDLSQPPQLYLQQQRLPDLIQQNTCSWKLKHLKLTKIPHFLLREHRHLLYPACLESSFLIKWIQSGKTNKGKSY